MAADLSGSVYISTRWPSGVIWFHSQKSQFIPLSMIYPGPPHLANTNAVWIGEAGSEPAHRDRLAEIRGGRARIFEFGPHPSDIGALAVDASGRVLYSVNRADDRSEIIKYDPTEGRITNISSRFALDIAIDREQRIWLVGDEGLVVRSSTGRLLRRIRSPWHGMHDFISRIAYDGNRIWYEGITSPTYTGFFGWVDSRTFVEHRCPNVEHGRDGPNLMVRIVGSAGVAYIATWPEHNTVTAVHPNCQAKVIALPEDVYITDVAVTKAPRELLALDGFHRLLWRVKL